MAICTSGQDWDISIHALRGEGDLLFDAALDFGDISIHALRGEGDPSGVRFAVNCKDFNPRPPWGGRRSALPSALMELLFQSTPSVGRATKQYRA